MQVTIKINTDNDAFTDNMNGETARILETIAKKLNRDEYDVHTGEHRALFDSNGNAIGYFAVTN